MQQSQKRLKELKVVSAKLIFIPHNFHWAHLTTASRKHKSVSLCLYWWTRGSSDDWIAPSVQARPFALQRSHLSLFGVAWNKNWYEQGFQRNQWARSLQSI